MFNSRYPIVCSPMNGVSDLKLALACQKAGIVPSFIPYTYPNFKEFFADLEKYKTTNGDVLVALRFTETVDTRLTSKLIESGITHIELLEYNESDLTQPNIKLINKLRNSGIKILLKILTHLEIEPYKHIIDAVTIKGPEGAGRSEDVDLISEINFIIIKYPNIKIIASGGIKNSNDIKKYMDIGVVAVSIGTLFAVSKESSIPDTVKNKLLQSNSSDIRRLKNGARQRAIVFDEYSGDDFNNTEGLYSGLRTGNSGHIFMGNALGSITDIVSVQKIVDDLTSELE